MALGHHATTVSYLPGSLRQRESLARLCRARDAGNPTAIRAAEHEAINSHLSVATALARRYRNKGVDFEDLEQLARLGLVKAVRRWQPAVGADFLPFACPTILGEIKRYFRDASTAIRIPRGLHELHAEIELVSQSLEQRLGRPASQTELAAEAGVDVGRVHEQQAAVASCRVLSLDIPAVQGVAAELSGFPDAADSHGVEDWLSVRQAMSLLTDKERQLIRLRYFDGLSQARIGEIVGVCQMQISRLLRAVIGKIRDSIAADDADQADGDYWRRTG